MNSEVILCPGCQHTAQVPESLFGQTVRCRECRCYFTAPSRKSDGTMTAAVLLPEPPAVGRTNVQTRKPPFSKSPLFIPALFLLLVGVIGSLVNLAMAMQWFISPEGTIENRTIYINSIGSKLGKELNGDELNEGLKILRTVETIVGFASLLREGAVK